MGYGFNYTKLPEPDNYSWKSLMQWMKTVEDYERIRRAYYSGWVEHARGQQAHASRAGIDPQSA